MKTGRNAPRRRAQARDPRLTETARTTITPELSDWIDDQVRLTGISRAEVIRSGLEMVRDAQQAGGLPLADAGRYRALIVAAQRQTMAAALELSRTSEALGMIAVAATGELADSGPLKAA